MGFLKAGIGSVAGALQDTWREYIYCSAMSADVLVQKGVKRNEKGGNNGSDNIITNGSIIAINDGQCMLIVENGKVVDMCAEPGEFVYDMSSEPSLFTGNLSQGIRDTFANIGKRFTMGGEAGSDERVYFVNTKEIIGNKYGTPNAVPFRVVDKNAGLDVDISIRCFGEYSYHIADPVLFYTNVCGNVQDAYTRDALDSQLKTELLTALQPAFAKISEQGIRYSALPGHAQEIGDALNEVLSEKWRKLRGIEIVSFGVSSATASEEDEDLIKQMQKNAAFRDPTMAAANLAGAQADAMRAAASNANGAAAGFVGMNMAANAGGMNAQNLYAMGQQQAAAAPTPTAAPASAAGWTCSCGTVNTGKFCSNCGKPAPSGEWTCSCGTVNTGNFCSNCGKPKA